MNNYNTAICIVGICLVITALVIFINHLRTKKTIDTIENMLNAMKWAGVNHTEALTRHACPRLRPGSPII